LVGAWQQQFGAFFCVFRRCALFGVVIFAGFFCSDEPLGALDANLIVNESSRFYRYLS